MPNEYHSSDESRRKMTDKEIELFTRNNPEAHKRFKRYKRKKDLKSVFNFLKPIFKAFSQIILWICAVGGFVLSLIQFFQNK